MGKKDAGWCFMGVYEMIKPFYESGLGKLFHGDCLEVMKQLDIKADLCLTDPPYNIGIDTNWDKWKTKAKYYHFMDTFFRSVAGLIKDNGSLYWFHNDMQQMANIMANIDSNTDFRFNSFIVWDKGDFRALSWKNPMPDNKLRSWFNTAEYCAYYTFQDSSGLETVMLDVNNFKPLRQYFKGLLGFIGMASKKIHEKLEHQKTDHCFRHSTTQWDMPTKETYQELIITFGIDKWEGFREYESLRVEYESLRVEYESLRYKHNIDKNHNNIWRFNSTNDGQYHPCEKPIKLLQRIIRTSSNEGDLILDPFAGSGTTAVACELLGRRWILIEQDLDYCRIAAKRIKKASEQFGLFEGKR